MLIVGWETSSICLQVQYKPLYKGTYINLERKTCLKVRWIKYVLQEYSCDEGNLEEFNTGKNVKYSYLQALLPCNIHEPVRFTASRGIDRNFQRGGVKILWKEGKGKLSRRKAFIPPPTKKYLNNLLQFQDERSAIFKNSIVLILLHDFFIK